MAKTKTDTKDSSTEEKILIAARKVFTKKGFAATRTRDIAEEAGINLALLNYYFRSKQKLFEMIMMEKVQNLFGAVVPTLNDTETSLEFKLDKIANIYIDMLSRNPDLPLFVLSEIKNNPEQFGNKMQAGKLIRDSHFIKQLQEKRPDVNPLHFLMNLIGMLLFPFIARPVFLTISNSNQKVFADMMEERKKLIPKWVNLMLKTK